MLLSILRPIAQLVLWIFFRRIEIKIDDQVVTDRPCIFVANHPNVMLDAMLLGLCAPVPTLRFIGNSTLFRRPLSAWLLQQLGVIPVVRPQDEGSRMANRALLRLASQTLEDGGSLALFPEGVSHTAPKVRGLKPGVARIVLRTEADADGRLGIHIIPVGLTYSNPTLFRGDVAVHFGEPIEVRSFLATYREDRDTAEEALIDLIHERMIALTWHIENLDLETVIRDLSVVYAEKIAAKLPDSVEFSKRLRAEQGIIRAVHHFAKADPELVQSFATRLRSHHRKLKRLYLEPSAVDPTVASPRAKYLLLAVLFFPLALYGFIHNALPYYLPRLFARSYRDEPVKIGTVKLFTGIILFPLFYLILIGIASPFMNLSLTFLYGLTLPLSGLFTLLYSERILQKRPLRLSFVLPRKRKYYLKRLTNERVTLIRDLDMIRERYIESLPAQQLRRIKMITQTLVDLMDESFEKHAGRTAIRTLQSVEKQGEKTPQYLPALTYGQLKEQRNRLASGLVSLDLQKGQRVGILTDGGIEPILIFLAADYLGLSSVPLCNKLPDELLIYYINHSGIVVLFVDPKSYGQLARIRSHLKHPPHLILTESQAGDHISFAQLMETGARVPPPDVVIAPDDESKVVYTSGSSGLPKGVVQTHANIVANVKSIWDVITERDPFDFFKSAPDYHAMGILNIYYPLAKGWTLDLARSPDRVLTDLRHSEPPGFLTVPLILDKVYGNVRKEIDAGGFKGLLIARAVRAKQNLARGKASLIDHLVHTTIGSRIVGQIRRKLSDRVGRRLELLIVGSAKADPDALDFFQEVLDIKAYEGYGVTECCPLIAVNHLRGQKIGTVGRPLIEVKLINAESREIGYGNPATGVYRGSDGSPGELWVHGPHVMKEYLNDPEQTAKVFVQDADGKTWYRTGDLFSMDNEGYLTFRGRVGRQFKLKNGEFVNPELLERLFARIPLIEHVLIYGDHTRTFPLPLVTVNLEEAKNQTDIPGLSVDDELALRVHPAIAERIREQMLREATNAGLPSHERPQKILLLPEPFSEEVGTLTRGLKKFVPKAIVSRYAALIEQTYGE